MVRASAGRLAQPDPPSGISDVRWYGARRFASKPPGILQRGQPADCVYIWNGDDARNENVQCGGGSMPNSESTRDISDKIHGPIACFSSAFHRALGFCAVSGTLSALRRG